MNDSLEVECTHVNIETKNNPSRAATIEIQIHGMDKFAVLEDIMEQFKASDILELIPKKEICDFLAE